MWASVIENGEISPHFEVTNGMKQGCGLASLLFVIFFSIMLHVTFKDCDVGITISYRIDGNMFDLRCLQAATKVQTAVIHDLLFADDCALVAHTLADVQTRFTRFLGQIERS